ncbi:MAG: hypothetical protein IJG33_13405 [Selenomonadaceae bacterium]|nr:hypothetical protein [Selenomonadaceae bacterium]MBQ6005614.1 hypothetical protein [Selenomonadaceae bacterium]MBR0289254.1 hypothetical protein [Selenomonadaceae bacterium]
MVKLISEMDLDEIASEEIFFVDTNILLVVHFGSRSWSEEKIACYSNFILGLLNRGNKICVSALNLQELCHSVENNEFKQYKVVNHKDRSFTKKMYRAIEEERKRLAKDLQSKHLEISEQYSVVSGDVTNDMIKNFLECYENHSYDPVDFITVRYNTNGIINFITDDSDFKKDSGIVVYTYE